MYFKPPMASGDNKDQNSTWTSQAFIQLPERLAFPCTDARVIVPHFFVWTTFFVVEFGQDSVTIVHRERIANSCKFANQQGHNQAIDDSTTDRLINTDIKLYISTHLQS